MHSLLVAVCGWVHAVERRNPYVRVSVVCKYLVLSLFGARTSCPRRPDLAGFGRGGSFWQVGLDSPLRSDFLTTDPGRSLDRLGFVAELGHDGAIRCTHHETGGIVCGARGGRCHRRRKRKRTPRCACRELAGRPRTSLWYADLVRTE